MQGKEPSAGLIHTFGDEVRRAGFVLILEGVVVLGVRHSAGVEPNVDEVEFATHGLAAGRNENDTIHVRAVQIDVGGGVVVGAIVAYLEVWPGVGFHETCLDGFVDLGKQFFDATNANLFLTVLCAPYR